MNGERPGGAARLAFVSPLFLFPNDAGGKIRTTNILRVALIAIRRNPVRSRS